ncbi:MAG: hypothetical protein AABZ84_06230 [Pseudomonadota bacterium]
MRYRVTALYDYPPVERTAIVEADSPQRAMVKALIEGRLPTAFRRDEQGWLEPLMWYPGLAGNRRWPRLAGDTTLEWGEEEARCRLNFYVAEVGEGE